ncbi:MAG TPA: LytTR family DNA-binding domain-containing protein [Sphingomicrobium sp.]|nr:LytTR family DNA-binding domain-containing protein [Sphingomicrobium sp.]
MALWSAQFLVLTGFSLSGQYPHPLESAVRRLAIAVVGILLFSMIARTVDWGPSRSLLHRSGTGLLSLIAGSTAWSLFAFAIIHAPVGAHSGAAATMPILRELALNAAAVAGLFAAWVCLCLVIGYRHALVETIQRTRAEAEAVEARIERSRLERKLESSAVDGLWVPIRNGKMRLPLGAVDYFEAEHDYVRIHARSGRYLIHHRLEALHDELDSARFVRVHRSFVVNLAEVAELRRRSRGLLELILASGAVIPVGRTYLASVQEQLGFRSSAASGRQLSIGH